MKTETKKHAEYLRRNILHAKAVGAEANARAALKRLAATKRPARWLIEALLGIAQRVEKVHPEIAKWRDTAPDRPEYVP